VPSLPTGFWTTKETGKYWHPVESRSVHNPVSNLKLGSGIAPIAAMKEAGVRIALGTDRG